MSLTTVTITVIKRIDLLVSWLMSILLIKLCVSLVSLDRVVICILLQNSARMNLSQIFSLTFYRFHLKCSFLVVYTCNSSNMDVFYRTEKNKMKCNVMFNGV